MNGRIFRRPCDAAEDQDRAVEGGLNTGGGGLDSWTLSTRRGLGLNLFFSFENNRELVGFGVGAGSGRASSWPEGGVLLRLHLLFGFSGPIPEALELGSRGSAARLDGISSWIPGSSPGRRRSGLAATLGRGLPSVSPIRDLRWWFSSYKGMVS